MNGSRITKKEQSTTSGFLFSSHHVQYIRTTEQLLPHNLHLAALYSSYVEIKGVKTKNVYFKCKTAKRHLTMFEECSLIMKLSLGVKVLMLHLDNLHHFRIKHKYPN